jgi:hypothetical protein
MIEDIIKDRVFGIISYCDTIEKVKVLIENIYIIRNRFPDYKIAVQANYPLSEDVQKLCDMYYYQDLNFVHTNKWIYYWNIMINDDLQQPYFNRKFFYSIQDIGYSVFQQIKAITHHLIDYKWMMLINYDTSVEEIRIEDYNTDYELTLHMFPDRNGNSLIIMFYNPRAFYDKIANRFTLEKWSDAGELLNEERFYNMIKESDIRRFELNYKISDKISGEPDYLRPNAPDNKFFKSYLLYFYQNVLEIYIWNLSVKINQIMIKVNGRIFFVENKNLMGGFENTLKYNTESITEVTILKINNVDVNIPLRIKPGYITRPI